MKIKRFTVKNVTSYKERTEFTFDKRINILIGPNGGGKSNLQKILALVLSKYFIHQYELVFGVKGIVKLTTDRNWINGIEEESRRVELGDLICQILDVSAVERKKLEQELRESSVASPQPVSERTDRRKGERGQDELARVSWTPG